MSRSELEIKVRRLDPEIDSNLIEVLEINQDSLVSGHVFENKDKALKFLSQSESAYRMMAMVYGGVAIGTIVTGLGILLKDPNVGQIQLTAGMVAIGWGAVMGIGAVDARRKSKTVSSEISEVQNI